MVLDDLFLLANVYRYRQLLVFETMVMLRPLEKLFKFAEWSVRSRKKEMEEDVRSEFSDNCLLENIQDNRRCIIPVERSEKRKMYYFTLMDI